MLPFKRVCSGKVNLRIFAIHHLSMLSCRRGFNASRMQNRWFSPLVTQANEAWKDHGGAVAFTLLNMRVFLGNQQTIQPSNQSASQPASQPANQRTNEPTNQPTNQPTRQAGGSSKLVRFVCWQLRGRCTLQTDPCLSNKRRLLDVVVGLLQGKLTLELPAPKKHPAT